MLRIYSAIHLQHWSPAERESKAHQAEPSVWKTWEGDFKMKTPFPSECLRESQCNALRGRLQSFALADAKLCVGRCNALRWRMQSFAWAIAKLCVGRCNALRWRMQSFASEMGKTGTEIVSPILDKRKGRVDSPYGALLPQGNFCWASVCSKQNKSACGEDKKKMSGRSQTSLMKGLVIGCYRVSTQAGH